MENKVDIRAGTMSDIESITDIFNYYIEHTNARFEEKPLSYQDRQQWFAQFSEGSKHQIYVALEHSRLIGFACSQPYRACSAFDDTVEVTVYLMPEAAGKGYGTKLYSRLFSAIKAQGVHRALSGIALPNQASVTLHKHFGFHEVGIFDAYAKKNGQYISSMWLEKKFNC